MNLKLKCPNCSKSFKLNEARTEILQPEKSTADRKFYLVYTVCPNCKKDLDLTGERLGAGVVLAVFICVMIIFNVYSEYFLSLSAIPEYAMSLFSQDVAGFALGLLLLLPALTVLAFGNFIVALFVRVKCV